MGRVGALLREDPDAFDALRDLTADTLDIDPGAIEKDYWATEVVRGTALGICTTQPCFSAMTASKMPSPTVGSPNSWSTSTSAARPQVGRSHRGGGFATSVAFGGDDAIAEALRDGYARLADLVWGGLPAFDEAIDIVRRGAHIL